MANIVVKEGVAWIYFAKCYPKNLIQFPLSLYLYIGQTLCPDDRPEQHMTEDKNNWKFELLRSLTSFEDWEFVFRPIIRKCGESFENYMNRVAIEEKQLIRDFKTNYMRYGSNSYGLNASDGGEHPANGGVGCNIPGETSGLKYIHYHKFKNSYIYQRNVWENGKIIKTYNIFQNKNPFICFLYAESLNEKDIIVNEKIFWNNVLKWWNIDIYKSELNHDYVGIKTVSINKNPYSAKGYRIICQKRIKGKKIFKGRALFSDFLKLYRDGTLNTDDIYNLDFFIWNAKLVLEDKFDIENSRPDVFYDNFFEFRKIHHFTVDNLQEAIDFLKVIEHLTENKLSVGQQTLQCT